ncbi:MAG: pilus assembly protein N-terminal domain-containing protein [Cyanobacteria bacterium]|nr:pilus assembly protein N-terminal domain-containing protein [Cyanobacteriota bacterium]
MFQIFNSFNKRSLKTGIASTLCIALIQHICLAASSVNSIPTGVVSFANANTVDAMLKKSSGPLHAKSDLIQSHLAMQLALSTVKKQHLSDLVTNNSQQMPVKNTNSAKKLVKSIPSASSSVLALNTSSSVVIKTSISKTLDTIDVPVGKASIITLKRPAARVTISDPNIASALILSPTQIQIVGSKVGVANLVLWENIGNSHYSMIDLNIHRDVSNLTRQLKQLDPRLNVEPIAANDTVILSGDAESMESRQMAVDLARSYFQGSDSGGASSPSSQGASGNNSGGNSASSGSSGSSNSSSSGASSGSSSSSGGSSGAQTSSGSTGTSRGLQGNNSFSPGSSMPGSVPKIINLIRVPGIPSTKAALVQQKLLAIDPNIKMDVIPGADGVEKVILTGRVKNSSTISKAINTASIFYGTPGIKVLTGPGGNGVRSSGSADFQDDKKFSDNVDINILQGSVIADSSGNVISMMQVAYRPQIRCKIKFLDISRVALNQIGHNLIANFNDVQLGTFNGSQSPATGKSIASFDPKNTGQVISNAITRSNSGTSTQSRSQTFSINPVYGDGVTQFISVNQRLGAVISALTEKRKARSLAEPTLTLLSGEKASFLAGGEVPVPVLGSNGQINVQYKEFGIRLNIIATITEDEKIHLQVSPEISERDDNNSITTNIVTVPGFRTRRLQSTLELRTGESFVMGGLFSQVDQENFSGFPGLGTLPVIGSFFRNKNSNKTDSEMIVIVQPEVMMVENDLLPVTK